MQKLFDYKGTKKMHKRYIRYTISTIGRKQSIRIHWVEKAIYAFWELFTSIRASELRYLKLKKDFLLFILLNLLKSHLICYLLSETNIHLPLTLSIFFFRVRVNKKRKGKSWTHFLYIRKSTKMEFGRCNMEFFKIIYKFNQAPNSSRSKFKHPFI